MHPETHVALHRVRAAELHAQAEAHRLAAGARQPYGVRARVGWVLVEVGLRLAAGPRPAPTH